MSLKVETFLRHSVDKHKVMCFISAAVVDNCVVIQDRSVPKL